MNNEPCLCSWVCILIVQLCVLCDFDMKQYGTKWNQKWQIKLICLSTYSSPEYQVRKDQTKNSPCQDGPSKGFICLNICCLPFPKTFLFIMHDITYLFDSMLKFTIIENFIRDLVYSSPWTCKDCNVIYSLIMKRLDIN